MGCAPKEGALPGRAAPRPVNLFILAVPCNCAQPQLFTCRCKVRMSGLSKVEMSGFMGGRGPHGNGENRFEPTRTGSFASVARNRRRAFDAGRGGGTGASVRPVGEQSSIQQVSAQLDGLSFQRQVVIGVFPILEKSFNRTEGLRALTLLQVIFGQNVVIFKPALLRFPSDRR